MFLYLLNFFLIIFCASPLGRDKKTKFKFSQFILLTDVILGNFFFILLSKKLIFFPKYLVAHKFTIFTLGCLIASAQDPNLYIQLLQLQLHLFYYV